MNVATTETTHDHFKKARLAANPAGHPMKIAQQGKAFDRAGRYRVLRSGLLDKTMRELRTYATELDVPGRSSMRKQELVEALARCMSAPLVESA